MCSLAILLKNIKLVALAAFVVFALAYRMFLVHQRDAARQRVQVLERESASLRDLDQSLRETVMRQNLAIADLRARGEQAEARERAAAVVAARVAGRSEYEAREILHARVPQECGAAMRWLASRGAELGKW
jgi:hypothetical protein